MKWRWLGLGAVVVLVVVGGAASFWAYTDARARFDETAAELRAALAADRARFVADEQRLSALPLFAPRHGRDAGALLATKIPYPDAQSRFHYPHVVPEALAKKLDAVPPARFPAAAVSLDVDGVDTSWMAGLAGFDQWDLFTAPVVNEDRPLHLDTMPLPSVVEALRFAKVRLLQGLAHDDGPAAGRDVEALARLMGTTEIAAVEGQAPALLRAERAAFDYARAHGKDVAGWAPLDEQTLAAYARVLEAYRAFLDVHADPAVAAALTSSDAAAVGRCAAVQETARVLLQIEPVAPALYAGAHTMITRALADTAGTCRLTRVREAWDHPGQRSILVGNDALCDPEDGSCVFTSIGGHLPGLREAMVEELGMQEPASLLRGYRPPAVRPPAP